VGKKNKIFNKIKEKGINKQPVQMDKGDDGD